MVNGVKTDIQIQREAFIQRRREAAVARGETFREPTIVRVDVRTGRREVRDPTTGEFREFTGTTQEFQKVAAGRAVVPTPAEERKVSKLPKISPFPREDIPILPGLKAPVSTFRPSAARIPEVELRGISEEVVARGKLAAEERVLRTDLPTLVRQQFPSREPEALTQARFEQRRIVDVAAQDFTASRQGQSFFKNQKEINREVDAINIEAKRENQDTLALEAEVQNFNQRVGAGPVSAAVAIQLEKERANLESKLKADALDKSNLNKKITDIKVEQTKLDASPAGQQFAQISEATESFPKLRPSEFPKGSAQREIAERREEISRIKREAGIARAKLQDPGTFIEAAKTGALEFGAVGALFGIPGGPVGVGAGALTFGAVGAVAAPVGRGAGLITTALGAPSLETPTEFAVTIGTGIGLERAVAKTIAKTIPTRITSAEATKLKFISPEVVEAKTLRSILVESPFAKRKLTSFELRMLNIRPVAKETLQEPTEKALLRGVAGKRGQAVVSAVERVKDPAVKQLARDFLDVKLVKETGKVITKIEAPTIKRIVGGRKFKGVAIEKGVFGGEAISIPSGRTVVKKTITEQGTLIEGIQKATGKGIRFQKGQQFGITESATAFKFVEGAKGKDLIGKFLGVARGKVITEKAKADVRVISKGIVDVAKPDKLKFAKTIGAKKGKPSKILRFTAPESEVTVQIPKAIKVSPGRVSTALETAAKPSKQSRRFFTKGVQEFEEETIPAAISRLSLGAAAAPAIGVGVKAVPAVKAVLAVRADIATETISATQLKQILEPKQKLKEAALVKTGQVALTKIDVGTVAAIKTAIATTPAQAAKIDVVQRQKIITALAPSSVLAPVDVLIPRKPPPFRISLPGIAKPIQQIIDPPATVPGHYSEVKAKGEWKRIKGIRQKNEAQGLAATVVDNSVSRSFRTKKADKSITPPIFPRFSFGASLARKFRGGKRERVFVEKSRFAIDSFGEHQGITVKGWAALRNLKLSGIPIRKKKRKRR